MENIKYIYFAFYVTLYFYSTTYEITTYLIAFFTIYL